MWGRRRREARAAAEAQEAVRAAEESALDEAVARAVTRAEARQGRPGPLPPRPWTWSVQGGPEPVFSVRVAHDDAERLADLVRSTALPGFVLDDVFPGDDPPRGASLHHVDHYTYRRLLEQQAAGRRRNVYTSTGVALDGDRLCVYTSYGPQDATLLDAQARLLARLACADDVDVADWSVDEHYEGRTWASGWGSASLRAHLGLEARPAPRQRRWTSGLRGRPEDGFVVRVRPGDAGRLVDLVRGAPLRGFVENLAFPAPSLPGRPALSYVDEDGHQYLHEHRSTGLEHDTMQFDRVEVQDAHLVLLRTYGGGSRSGAAQVDLLVRLALADDIEVERWSKGERYDALPWAEGTGTDSLKRHLRL